ncbi:MAG: transcriptional repressor, partial [Pseudomonadota bacterium]
ESPHGAQLLICRNCRSVAEFSDAGVDEAIDRLSRDQSFQPSSRTVEVHGLCPSCRDPESVPGDRS